MDKETDKQLEEFTEKLLGHMARETPSFDFTTRVMSQVKVLSESYEPRHKPLISKKLWLFMAVFVAGVFSYSIFGNVQTENSWLSYIKLDIWPNFNTFFFSEYKISNVFLYGLVGFTLFMGIQILLLKNHFDKRFAMD